MDIIVELDGILREHYPAKDTDRVNRVAKVIQNKETWTPQELVNELPAISSLTAHLGGPQSEADLLRVLEK